MAFENLLTTLKLINFWNEKFSAIHNSRFNKLRDQTQGAQHFSGKFLSFHLPICHLRLVQLGFEFLILWIYKAEPKLGVIRLSVFLKNSKIIVECTYWIKYWYLVNYYPTYKLFRNCRSMIGVL